MSGKGLLVVGVVTGLLSTPLRASAQAGAISGTVSTRVVAPRPAVRVTIDQRECGDEAPDEAILVNAAGGLANAVVTLAGVKARASSSTVEVLNEQCRFAPRVQIVAPNGSVRTSSRDKVLHTTTVQTSAGRPIFSVALPVPGITVTRTLGGPGVAQVSCNTHPWMKGWLIVSDEMAVVTGRDGSFTLNGVPPGSYELRFWHEALGAQARKVTVEADRTVKVAVEMK